MLDLSTLGSGSIPAITPALGSMLAEAAGVCLESQGHPPNVQLTVRGFINRDHSLTWPPISQQALRAWNDTEYATEHGAIGIALILARWEFPYEVIEASRKGTGFDYWLGDASDDTFQRKGRLEISGIRRGDKKEIQARVRQKVKQTKLSDPMTPNMPAYVIVVEFGNPLTEVRQR